jgi:hypothetical protein
VGVARRGKKKAVLFLKKKNQKNFHLLDTLWWEGCAQATKGFLVLFSPE